MAEVWTGLGILTAIVVGAFVYLALKLDGLREDVDRRFEILTDRMDRRFDSLTERIDRLVEQRG
jgi:hypothetical protein